MTFTVESKSQLAKLMATENLRVEHQKISTAKFDPKNRVLYCPIWQNMTGALYDLLMGHEVGHALYTPPEGWHDAVSARGANYKGFLNVVEDCRIEKKVKRKYPGLKYSFSRGYDYLVTNDFFQIKGRNLNEMSFIDRLNIHTKMTGLLNIKFTDEEMDLVKQVEACETWEDVIRVTQAVFDYSKDEQFEMQQMLQSMAATANGAEEESDDGYEYGESDYDEELDGESEQSVGEKREPSDGDEGQTKSKSGESNDDVGEDGDEYGNEYNPYKDSAPSTKDQFQPECSTDKAFRQNEDKLLDEKCKEYVYMKLPTPIMENIITPASKVQQFLSEYYTVDNVGQHRYNMIDLEVNKFKERNDRYIGMLAKEFEMKKAAKAFSKAKIANTGDIDISRLYRYQVDDNIFRKTMRVPKGKSHGLVLLLDRSGSMGQNMAGSIEQVLILSMFCRKVNIPFVVYGFGDSIEGRYRDFKEIYEGKYPSDIKSFTQNAGEIDFDTVFLREYLSSNMKSAEFKTAFRNMMALKMSYDDGIRYLGRPQNEDLSNTPLNQAMVALAPITNQFRKVNNLDIVNLVVVHDGDADNTYRMFVENDSLEGEKYKITKRFDPTTYNLYLTDGKKQMKIERHAHDYYTNHDDGMRIAIFDWYKKQTGAKIFGFFLAGDRGRLREGLTVKYIDEKGESVYANVKKQMGIDNTRYVQFARTDYVKDLVSKLRENKFLQSYNKGYESFFILPGGSELKIDENEGEIVINGAVTAGKLKTAFMKMNKKRQVNRVMVSRFIDGIAI